MKKNSWFIYFGLILLALSAVLYALHVLIFKDLHHVLLFTAEDIAFLPIEVLIVTLIIDRLLENRQKEHILEKLNMVISAFFSEVGTKLIKKIRSLDDNADQLEAILDTRTSWKKKDFTSAKKQISKIENKLNIKREDFIEIRDFLDERRNFILRLLENPSLLEHDSFTDLLMAVFHLSEELSLREDINKISDEDLEHLVGDAQRAYKLLIIDWLNFMRHLSTNYPYLYSLEVRGNPFQKETSVEIKAI